MSNDPNCPFGMAMTPEIAVIVDRQALANFRKFVGEWHDRSVSLGFDGVASMLDQLAGWRAALAFYAEKSHFAVADDSAWDTVSGEPANFWCDEAGTATVEDGTVA